MPQDYFSQVPIEISLGIIKGLSQSDLKNCRLVSKCVSPIAEELLFRELRLNRNIESFQKLDAVAHNCRLSEHVTKLVYGVVTRNRPHNAHDTYLNYRMLEAALRLDPSNHQEPGTHFPYGEEVVDRHNIKMTSLTRAIRLLPRLEHLVVDAFSGFLPISAQRVTRSGRRVDDILTKQIKALFTTAYTTSTSVKTFGAIGVKTSDFHVLTDAEMGVLKDCKELNMSLESRGSERFGTHNVVKMMATASKLQVLNFSLDSTYRELYGSYLTSRPLVEQLFSQQLYWPNLRSLQLRGLRVTEMELRAMLEAHATTLRSLTLGNTTLIPNISVQPPVYGSWVSLITFLQDALKLSSVTLEGLLRNSYIEVWRLDNKAHSSDCLKNHIERFVIHGGECPLRSLTEEDYQNWLVSKRQGCVWYGTLARTRTAMWEEHQLSDESWSICLHAIAYMRLESKDSVWH